MPRLIDADALIIAFCENPSYSASMFSKIRARINAAPTIEAEPVVHGRWEKSPHLYGFVRCSVCHGCTVWDEWVDGKKWNYCPNCGAKMDQT